MVLNLETVVNRFVAYKCIKDMSEPKSWGGIEPESLLLLMWLQRCDSFTRLEKQRDDKESRRFKKLNSQVPRGFKLVEAGSRA